VNANATGIINVNDAITAVTWNGQILCYDGSSFTEFSSGGPRYTGGMSIWNDGTDDKLLLLGVQDAGNYKRGYREISLDASFQPDLINRSIRTPGDIELSSVKPEDRKKYEASIARYSVYHILQVPGGSSVVFASTANNGLQSLKGGLWNAEE
jgi:hypothetical protein